MIMAAIPNQSRQRGVAPAMQDLISDIEDVVSKACTLRRRLEHDPDKQLSALALDDMLHLLAEVKLRLRIDASGNYSR
jgi:hypothetical protein